MDYRFSGPPLLDPELPPAVGEAQRVAGRRCVMLEASLVHPTAESHDDSLWFGTASLLAAAGFTTVAQPQPRRSVLRGAPPGYGASSPVR
jgi:hypothetical protein